MDEHGKNKETKSRLARIHILCTMKLRTAAAIHVLSQKSRHCVAFAVASSFLYVFSDYKRGDDIVLHPPQSISFVCVFSDYTRKAVIVLHSP